MSSPTAPERFDRVAATASYQHAMDHAPHVPRSHLGASLAIGLALPLLGGAILLAMMSESVKPTTVLFVLAIAGSVVVSLLIQRRATRRSAGAPVERVLAVVVNVESTRAVYNPVTVTLQRRDGSRSRHNGLRPLVEKHVAPGDIGVAYITRMSLMGDVIVDFTRLDG
jgi:hypothetical protein